jgi:DNA polymerase-1
MCKPFHINEDVENGKLIALEQFLITLNSYLKLLEPNHLIIADDSFFNWRKELNKTYKANRIFTEPPTKLDIGFNNNKKQLRKILPKLFPLYFLKIDYLEADDIIYYLCKHLKDYELTILSTDGDLLQIKQKFDNVQVYHPIKKQFLESPVYDVLRYKSIAGDSSDNIKGIVGIGDKGAKKILESKQTFNEWYKNLSEDKIKEYKSCKKIIDFEQVPEQYEKEFKKLLKEFEFNDNFDYEKVESYLEENKLKRFNIQVNKKQFERLKQIRSINNE